MRPINKGGWPTRKNNSAIKLVFTDWSKARVHLVERTGQYCHLCEIQLPMGLAVEHIKPKEIYKSLSNNWSNFLLICTSCNSRKKVSDPVRPYRFRYYWPHLNNTLMAFCTSLTGPDALLVKPHSGLSAAQLTRAEATIELYKLDQRLLASGEGDARYTRKAEIGSKAVRRYLEYKSAICTLDSILDNVLSDGFFSLWLEVFKNEKVVIDAILDLPGFFIDRPNWFNATNDPVGRNPTRPDVI
ncbi:HNH endonuclease [Pseudomonas koreensis]|uniref:HNH endonuclease n=1 Tax=Pseudomonas koreensis TaxID=198620 RepID=UPI00087C05DD|nr:HNH endonuclease [Pseudomonas koreensis]KAB0514190.1 hypothetical protein F7R05_07985 [Pseudomonas koreensis]NNA62599.1 hypothetical protein [Pseudomonas koreensis]SDC60737.1 HNH endonuclease [Pseudomonas koreensis]